MNCRILSPVIIGLTCEYTGTPELSLASLASYSSKSELSDSQHTPIEKFLMRSHAPTSPNDPKDRGTVC
jgi:hypothetical protein